MINPPYNDAQLREEAADWLPGEDPLVVFCDMAGHLPWAVLDADGFNEAHDKVMALIGPPATPERVECAHGRYRPRSCPACQIGTRA